MSLTFSALLKLIPTFSTLRYIPLILSSSAALLIIFSNVKRLIFSVWLLSRIGRGNGILKFKSNSSPLVSLSPIIFRLFICNRLFLDTVISSFVDGVNRAPIILKKMIIIIILIVMSVKSHRFKRYSLLMVVGGALGNLHDRIFFNAVPDFIDFHVGEFHWFIFNVADIFITTGIIFMILTEIVDNNNKDEKI